MIKTKKNESDLVFKFSLSLFNSYLVYLLFVKLNEWITLL